MTINANWHTFYEGKEPGTRRENHLDNQLHSGWSGKTSEGVPSDLEYEGGFKELDTGQCVQDPRGRKALTNTEPLGKGQGDEGGWRASHPESDNRVHCNGKSLKG